MMAPNLQAITTKPTSSTMATPNKSLRAMDDENKKRCALPNIATTLAAAKSPPGTSIDDDKNNRKKDENNNSPPPMDNKKRTCPLGLLARLCGLFLPADKNITTNKNKHPLPMYCAIKESKRFKKCPTETKPPAHGSSRDIEVQSLDFDNNRNHDAPLLSAPPHRRGADSFRDIEMGGINAVVPQESVTDAELPYGFDNHGSFEGISSKPAAIASSANMHKDSSKPIGTMDYEDKKRYVPPSNATASAKSARVDALAPSSGSDPPNAIAVNKESGAHQAKPGGPQAVTFLDYAVLYQEESVGPVQEEVEAAVLAPVAPKEPAEDPVPAAATLNVPSEAAASATGTPEELEAALPEPDAADPNVTAVPNNANIQEADDPINGTDPLEEPEIRGFAPIHHAVYGATADSLQNVEDWLDVSPRASQDLTGDGSNALHVLLEPGSDFEPDAVLPITRLLIEANPNCTTAKNHAGRTSLHLACERANDDETLDLIKFLVNTNAAALMIQDSFGSTPLLAACFGRESMSQDVPARVIRFLVGACHQIEGGTQVIAHALEEVRNSSYHNRRIQQEIMYLLSPPD